MRCPRTRAYSARDEHGFGWDDEQVSTPTGSVSAAELRRRARSLLPFSLLRHRWAQYGGARGKLLIARQNMDAAELEFGDMLIEDKNAGALSYIDCTFLSVAVMRLGSCMLIVVFSIRLVCGA